VALVVHPRFGEEFAAVSAYGRNAVFAETSDGELRLLPIVWTTLHVRPEPLALEGRPVRLAPQALRELALWVAARFPGAGTRDREEVAARAGGSDKGRDAERSRPAGAEPESAAAVVGEAGSPGARARAQRARRGKR
jgi:hypothetical protein